MPQNNVSQRDVQRRDFMEKVMKTAVLDRSNNMMQNINLRKFTHVFVVPLVALTLLFATILLISPATVSGMNPNKFTPTHTCNDIPQAECDVLEILYNSTDGENWLHNSGWLQTPTACSWYGVSCFEGHVTQLLLYQNQLSGTIPDISALTNLRYYVLNDNQLSGTIPNLSTFTNLLVLSLSNNQFDGMIPALPIAPNMWHLGLAHNQLTGSIPDLSGLTGLQELYLYDNQLSGNIPDLSGLTNLEELHLYNNQLVGNIPDVSMLSNLIYLYINDNNLDGEIPDLSGLTSIRYIYLHNNQLNGTIPDLSTLTTMLVIGLNDNQLSGSVPDVSSLTSLFYINLGGNKLEGSIPSFSTLSNLRYLLLDENQLSGTVHSSVCQTIDSLDLGYNKLDIDTADPCVDVTDIDWKDTQTVPPTNINTSSDIFITLDWTPITYTVDGGYYEVWGRPQGETNYSLKVTTADKTTTSATVASITPGVTYEFVVRTFTPAHGDQQNALTSADSNMVTGASTGEPERVFLPSIMKAP